MDISTVMTTPQAAVARRLARGFRHAWGCCEATAGLVSPAAIEAAVIAECDADEECSCRYSVAPMARGCPRDGITRPWLDERGSVTHETASRRIQWAVLRNGLAVVTIHRPAGPVIEAVIDPAEGWTGRLMAPRHEVARRHVTALEWALHALGMTRKVRLSDPGEFDKDYARIVDGVASRLVTLDHAELALEAA